MRQRPNVIENSGTLAAEMSAGTSKTIHVVALTASALTTFCCNHHRWVGSARAPALIVLVA
jgi:hypothetical protein